MAVALIGPLIPLYRITKVLWRILAGPDVADSLAEVDKHHRADLPFVIGLLERPLYFGAWLVHMPAFIGIWLATKVAGGWQGWSTGRTIPTDKAKIEVLGRHVFNVFLIGSGLSLLNAVAGARITQLLLVNDRQSAALVLTGTVALTYGVWVWAEFAWISLRDAKHAA